MAIRRIETVATADSAPLARALNGRITPLSRVAVVLATNLAVAPPATAETMSSALVRAYIGNPDMNQQRAGVRAQDENIPRATSGWRPQASATGQVGYNYQDFRQLGTRLNGSTLPTTIGLSVTQNVFNGNRTLNSVRQAESGVFGAREDLRNTEQNVLQNGATAYMNVLRDTAVLELRRNNITVLEEQLRQTRDRFNVGEVTRTDVAQAESSLANSRSEYFVAQANLQNSIANFRQIIGVEPTRLEPARTIEALLPKNMNSAVALALEEHPAIQAVLHAVDQAELQVKLVEGELAPSVNIVGSVQRATDYQGIRNASLVNGQVVGQISVPIYMGGEVYARVRQAKETLAQTRLQADLQRDSVRATVVSAYGQLDSSKAVIQSAKAAVKAAEIALDGIREEAKVGQRTTFDVLFAQQTLLNTRVSLVTAQRDRVVASYNVMAAIGKLSAANLSLNVAEYDPTVHFEQVKDKWIGLRTPDGR
ncbi:type I secretion outer membrane protein, TolC family [Methylocella silvestris BL2]|uniref:Type I secretion outer membrane protein, TolC family n=1 Tax=Methylocella silvestris (strain DSM 15510 / CIP 108128 / LMG 27833 / NCIMB 13906 / BL2) TaxID=395965 RepID=B8EST1_METSB|nr:TolC family outer membrane protein [Methylocella silvestris]ACK50416.1 type I secretion outer membrane protein, TolC family [Methylocella silvestris BL2]